MGHIRSTHRLRPAPITHRQLSKLVQRQVVHPLVLHPEAGRMGSREGGRGVHSLLGLEGCRAHRSARCRRGRSGAPAARPLMPLPSPPLRPLPSLGEENIRGAGGPERVVAVDAALPGGVAGGSAGRAVGEVGGAGGWAGGGCREGFRRWGRQRSTQPAGQPPRPASQPASRGAPPPGELEAGAVHGDKVHAAQVDAVVRVHHCDLQRDCSGMQCVWMRVSGSGLVCSPVGASSPFILRPRIRQPATWPTRRMLSRRGPSSWPRRTAQWRWRRRRRSGPGTRLQGWVGGG